MYFLTVLEARSLRSRWCWQSRLLLRLWLGIWSKSPSFRWCWKSLYHPDFCLHFHMPFSLCVCLWIKVSPLYKGTSPIGLGSTLLPVWPHLDCISAMILDHVLKSWRLGEWVELMEKGNNSALIETEIQGSVYQEMGKYDTFSPVRKRS